MTEFITLYSEDEPRLRQCGGCTLCCRLVPVAELHKPAGKKCDHQRFGGCAIYASARFPTSCKLWSCSWLADPAAGDLRRPDRAHYVIDPMPDFVTLKDEQGRMHNEPVVQIWIDPKFPDAHRDPALRAFLEKKNIIALVRFNSVDAIALVPPGLNPDRRWYEVDAQNGGRQHTHAEIDAVYGQPQMKVDVEW